MTEQEYLERVQAARQHIEAGTEKDLAMAQDELAALENIRPQRVAYICARIALALKRGEDKNLCRAVLDHIDQEFYPHEDLVDIFQLKKQTFSQNSIEAQQAEFSRSLYAGEDSFVRYFQPLRQREKSFLAEPLTVEAVQEMAEAYYVVRDMTLYVVLMLLWARLAGRENYRDYLIDDTGEAVVGSRAINLFYLLRMLTDGKVYTFALVHDLRRESAALAVLAKALQALGQQVIVLKPAVAAVSAADGQEKEWLARCINAATDKNGVIVIQPLEIRAQGCSAGDNRSDILRFLAQSVEQQAPLLVFSSDIVMDELHQCQRNAKHFQRLTPCQPEQFGYTTAFAWAGSYLKYVSYLYGFDAAARIDRPAECEFSIVLPVRNSVDTLRSTLQTCLQQDFSGEYEIVLSDNSDAGNQAVYTLYRELNHPRIRYYRTPFVLELAKSFEFAFLQARGEFIFSIGADDGVYPWALSTLHGVLAGVPSAELVKWRRGFYAWPGFNQGQQHQLIIPQFDEEKDVLAGWIPEHACLSKLMAAFGGNLYGQTLLYINSGFRRSYFRHLLSATGRLWDGASQDLPMGVINLAIYDRVLFVQRPLTVAGMSGHSIGAKSIKVVDDLTAFGQQMQPYSEPDWESQQGGYVQRRLEYKFPRADSLDILGFFWETLRLVDFGCLKERDLAPIDWPELFAEIFRRLDRDSLAVMRTLGWLQYAAAQLGEPMPELVGHWIQLFIAPYEQVKRELSMERNYFVGMRAAVSEWVVDASEYGIRDIEGAVNFAAAHAAIQPDI